MLLDAIRSLSVTSWLALAVVVMTSVYFLRRRPRINLPPSPGLSLPIIGHLYLMEKNPRKQFLKWRKRLGDIFTLQMGANTVVVLSGYEVLKETLVKQAEHFSDRPENNVVIKANPDGKIGILFSSGALWKEQRTTALSILREFGMGKNLLAEKINEEVSIYVDELAKRKGNPGGISMLTTMSVSNIICSIIFGRRFEFNDERFIRMLELLDESVKIVSGVAFVNFFPFLQRLPLVDIGGIKTYAENSQQIKEFCADFVKEHKEKHDPNKSDSLISAYLEEMNKKKQKGQETFLDERNLTRVMHNLFAAGTETTSNTILWFVLFCLHHPHVQKKVYQEIVDEIGLARPPNILDKPKLKYLNAAIMETLRLASIVPFSLQHVCSETVTIKGYTIPKGTQIVPHLDSVLMDEEIWGDPHEFRPERFLDDNGDLIKKEELVPFSMGRRVCMGEAIAKMELFLYLSTMFQRFEFQPVDPKRVPPLKDRFGITISPEPFDIRCVERKT